MKRRRFPLAAAIACTVGAAMWLANCVLDVVLCMPLSLPKHVLQTIAWTIGAVFCWVRWSWARPRQAIEALGPGRR